MNNPGKIHLNYILYAFICAVIGANLFLVSIGQMLTSNIFYQEYLFGPLLSWTAFGTGFVLLVASIFFVRESFGEL
ncbi:hypothetical protein J7W08_02520 [Methanococcoides orientis]|uniref:hypothetical protein n=1 Tax=Methanococcoides orientis TaxID=2822137 RepID=UPI001E28D80C|nr:hypothetical protein [Methanococcoides orientis]UGV41199.1 hypothetical protein J7W08_02520 [Methanococcoides orientis]